MEYQKTENSTSDLINNKIHNKIIGVSKDSQQNISEAVTNENDKEIPKKDIYFQEKGKSY